MTTKDPDESADRAELIGSELFYHPWVNKGTAFTEEERAACKLEGRLPPRVHSQDLQVEHVMEIFRKKRSDPSGTSSSWRSWTGTKGSSIVRWGTTSKR